MATTEHAVKLTYEDYCRAPDDKRYELLNGELMMVPAPNTKHQRILLRLGRELSRLVQEHELGEVFVAPLDVVLSDTDVVQPDVLFISRAREDRITDANVQGAPDLVIEILSSGRLRFRPVKVGGARADPGAEQPGIPSAGQ